MESTKSSNVDFKLEVVVIPVKLVRAMQLTMSSMLHTLTSWRLNYQSCRSVLLLPPAAAAQDASCK